MRGLHSTLLAPPMQFTTQQLAGGQRYSAALLGSYAEDRRLAALIDRDAATRHARGAYASQRRARERSVLEAEVSPDHAASAADGLLRYGDAVTLQAGHAAGALAANVGTPLARPSRHAVTLTPYISRPAGAPGVPARLVLRVLSEGGDGGASTPAGEARVVRYGECVRLAAHPSLFAVLDSGGPRLHHAPPGPPPLPLLSPHYLQQQAQQAQQQQQAQQAQQQQAQQQQQQQQQQQPASPPAPRSPPPPAPPPLLLRSALGCSKPRRAQLPCAPRGEVGQDVYVAGAGESECHSGALWRVEHTSGDALTTAGLPVRVGEPLALVHAATGAALAAPLSAASRSSSSTTGTAVGVEHDVVAVTFRDAARAGGGGAVAAHPANTWVFGRA